MRKFSILLILSLTIVACSKQSNQDSQLQLRRITVNGNIHENFEYNDDGQLKKDESYYSCTVPSDECTYVYKNKRLDSVKLVNRGIYSSSIAQCDPQSGIRTYSTFEYDNAGRIYKIRKENSTIEYTYNSVGRVDMQTTSGGGTNLHISTFKYDARGNLVETNIQGVITYYEFDNKKNPYFLMKRRPDVLISFFVSPNNVVKIKNPGGTAVVIGYEYNLRDMPTKMFDPNGLTYSFTYD